MSNESKSFGIISQGLKNEIFLRAYVDENQIFENMDILNGIKMFSPLVITQIVIIKILEKYKLEINFTIAPDNKQLVISLLERKGFTNLFNSLQPEKRSIKDNMSSTEMLQYNYWTKISEEINNNYPIFNSKKPQPQHSYDLAIGSSSAHISLHILAKSNEVRSLVRIHNKKLYNNLLESKDEIEKEIGLKLNWNTSEKNKSSTISLTKKFNINEDDWNESIKWQLDMAKKLYNAFHDKIKKFN